MAINLRLFSIAVAVAIIHLVSGLTIWLGYADYALHTTPMNFISVIFGNSTTLVGLVLIGTAIIALIPFLLAETHTLRNVIICIFPQQMLLILHFISIMAALATGHYPDGYVPNGGSFFIFVDQIWLMTIIFWHSIEYGFVLERKHD